MNCLGLSHFPLSRDRNHDQVPFRWSRPSWAPPAMGTNSPPGVQNQTAANPPESTEPVGHHRSAVGALAFFGDPLPCPPAFFGLRRATPGVKMGEVNIRTVTTSGHFSFS